MKVYVLLHGQTDQDIEKRIIGSNNPSLNDTGREQASSTIAYLQDKGINMILSSPQARTIETAGIIAEGLGIEPLKISKNPKLAERAFGEYEGKTADEVDMFALCSWFSNIATPGGETVREAANRVIADMNIKVRLFRTKTMMIVVPEHVLRILFWFFKGLPKLGAEDMPELEHCRIFEFETEDIPQEIKEYDPAAHMPKADTDSASSDPGRLLSQSEIDALIAQLTGG